MVAKTAKGRTSLKNRVLGWVYCCRRPADVVVWQERSTSSATSHSYRRTRSGCDGASGLWASYPAFQVFAAVPFCSAVVGRCHNLDDASVVFCLLDAEGPYSTQTTAGLSGGEFDCFPIRVSRDVFRRGDIRLAFHVIVQRVVHRCSSTDVVHVATVRRAEAAVGGGETRGKQWGLGARRSFRVAETVSDQLSA